MSAVSISTANSREYGDDDMTQKTYTTRALHDAREWRGDDIVLIETVPCSSCHRDIRPDERIRRTSKNWQDGWVHADCASVAV